MRDQKPHREVDSLFAIYNQPPREDGDHRQEIKKDKQHSWLRWRRWQATANSTNLYTSFVILLHYINWRIQTNTQKKQQSLSHLRNRESSQQHIEFSR